MKNFRESQQRFTNIDGDNFGGCMKYLSTPDVCLEWRIRKADNKLCIIQYFKDGKGYQIFISE